MIEKIENKIIKNIYFYYIDGDNYGLRILFEFELDEYLLFDSSKFIFLKQENVFKLYKWNKIEYSKLLISNVYIQEIKEDETIAFFIRFSTGDIFYIYQRIYGLGDWEQDFELILEDNNLRYNNILKHMNEDWIEKAIIENADI